MASHGGIWEVCRGMLKSWLESSKYLIVYPGLQRQDLFPEEHHTAILLSTLSEIATLGTWLLCVSTYATVLT